MKYIIAWVVTSIVVAAAWPKFEDWLAVRAWRREVRALQAKRIKR